MEKNILVINPENVSEPDLLDFKKRDSARGVIVNKNGKVALLHVTKKDYYKLPGGGIDDGENPETAFIRECKEETGCNVEIVRALGQVTELRKIFQQNQTSFCFVGKVVGDIEEPNLTDHEKENGFEIIWLEEQEAILKLKTMDTEDEMGRLYVKPRDVAIFEEYLKSSI